MRSAVEKPSFLQRSLQGLATNNKHTALLSAARCPLPLTAQVSTPGGSAAAGAAAAEQFWSELTGQSWRMDLDYGLNKDATLQALTEPLLVVLGSSDALQQLVSAAVAQRSEGSAGSCGDVCVVEFSGWNQGEKQQQLQSWQQLQPQLAQLPMGVPL